MCYVGKCALFDAYYMLPQPSDMLCGQPPCQNLPVRWCYWDFWPATFDWLTRFGTEIDKLERKLAGHCPSLWVWVFIWVCVSLSYCMSVWLSVYFEGFQTRSLKGKFNVKMISTNAFIKYYPNYNNLLWFFRSRISKKIRKYL